MVPDATPYDGLKEMTIPELKERYRKNLYEYNTLSYLIGAFGWDDRGTDENIKFLREQNRAINIILEHRGENPIREKRDDGGCYVIIDGEEECVEKPMNLTP